MQAFAAYNRELEGIFALATTGRQYLDRTFFDVISPARIERELRRLIPIDELRDAGTFFTGDELADQAVNAFPVKFTKNHVVLDPTCGTGNLLLACSRLLPTMNTAEDTLKLWGYCLRGWDIYPEFVEATKLRLILEAIQRGAIVNGKSLDELKKHLTGIEHKNALESIDRDLNEITHVFMNPPYCLVRASNDCLWSKGKVNSASIFWQHFVSLASFETSFAGILPEVLRSGSRYRRWRELLMNQLPVKTFIAGRFDNHTDVDVCIFSGRKALLHSSGRIINSVKIIPAKTVGDFFDIKVGAVVPHRNLNSGPRVPYIHARSIPRGGIVNIIDQYCSFSGRLDKPPFVVVRRTSSPSDKQRASATIVNTKEIVAVENHLIVIKPKDNSLKKCKFLMRILQNQKTNDFLNQRIRCRHLTVGSVMEIPYQQGKA